LNLSAYLPTGSAETGFAAALNMGNSPGFDCGESPGSRPVLLRSSSHSAHGQASRRKGNVYWERCPPFHSISTPVPEFSWTFTDFGSAEGIDFQYRRKAPLVVRRGSLARHDTAAPKTFTAETPKSPRLETCLLCVSAVIALPLVPEFAKTRKLA